MKKKIPFLPVLVLLPALATAQQQFSVTGRIGTYNAPVKAYLRYVEDGKIIMDSATLNNGTFRFTGAITEPTPATLLLNYGAGAERSGKNIEETSFYVENGVISFTSTDSLKHAKVKGGPVNADNQALDDALAENSKLSEKLAAEYDTTPEAVRKNEPFMSNWQARRSKAREQKQVILHKFFENHTNSIVSLDVLWLLGGANPDYAKVQPLFAQLDPAIRTSKRGKAYGDRLERIKAVFIGNVAPNFTQNDPEGKPVSLASFRGKYVLIDFWASWCVPCRAENPYLVKAYNEYKNKNFTILGVSLDRPDGKEKWLKAIKEDNLTWPQVSDLAFLGNEVAQLYAVISIPQNFLLDPNGVIIARNLRGEALAKKLEEVIK